MDNVLIIDDEEDICLYVKETLEEIDLHAEIALTGERGIELAHKVPFKLAIVDLKLATMMSGIDVIKALKEKSPKTIVMTMTGYIDDALKQETETLGVRYYLEKPKDIFDDDLLKSKVQTALSRQSPG